MSDNSKPTDFSKEPPTSPACPNEHGAVSVQGFVKIWDPTTAKVFVEKRA